MLTACDADRIENLTAYMLCTTLHSLVIHPICMSVSVRFPPRVEAELIKYCVSQNMTKSEVLIRAVTQYLGSGDARARLKPPADATQKASPIYQAFDASSFIGKVASGQPKHASATKERVADAARRQIADRK